MQHQWEYCTLTVFAEGEAISAEAQFHTTPADTPTETCRYRPAGVGLYELGKEGMADSTLNQ